MSEKFEDEFRRSLENINRVDSHFVMSDCKLALIVMVECLLHVQGVRSSILGRNHVFFLRLLQLSHTRTIIIALYQLAQSDSKSCTGH